ncbi:MAG: DNA polymerase III subunit epsilon [Sphingomonadaceae bacterium]|nr:DNA polymerase III subunit epsilon [Sphingomonadaceae bacterium]
MREIVFDTETTGLSPVDGHRLVEIGCVELINRVETGAVFHAYFNPGRSMPSEAEAVHGLSSVFLADKPRFGDKVEELLAFMGDAPLIAHNAGFDMAFLNWHLGDCGLAPLVASRAIDTVALARARHPGAKHSLDALCTRYGIDRSQRVKHGALLDAQLLAQVYIELRGGRQIGLALAPTAPAPVAANVAMSISSAPVRPVRPPRVHSASADELARHAAFVATLVDPLWPALAACG